MEPRDTSAEHEQPHRVRHVSPPESVPVFNCLVLVAPRNAASMIVARAANLAGLSAEAPTEREALQKLVAAFKAMLAEHQASGQQIPWLDPPQAPAPDEQQRWIAVHL
jgi:hypothetical protein